MSDYPRDMLGYAGRPPHAKWPNQARIAVQFVVNYEEGGENNILHRRAALARQAPYEYGIDL